MSSARQISGAPETPPQPSSSGRGAADSSVRRMRSGEIRAASPLTRGVEDRRPEATRALLSVMASSCCRAPGRDRRRAELRVLEIRAWYDTLPP